MIVADRSADQSLNVSQICMLVADRSADQSLSLCYTRNHSENVIGIKGGMSQLPPAAFRVLCTIDSGPSYPLYPSPDFKAGQRTNPLF